MDWVPKEKMTRRGWRRVEVDLDPYRGQTITLHFANWNRDYGGDPNYDTNNTWTYLDEIGIVNKRR